MTGPLHAEADGTPERPVVVLAHGFTQTGRLWGSFGAALARRHRVVRVDLPGHGGSSAVRAGLAEGASLLAAAGGGTPFDLVGYSLGGRFALHAALANPGLVRRLVLIGVSAGIDDPAARATRRRRDDAMADELERCGDVDGFLRRWLAQPMFAGLGAAAGLDERRRNTAAGLASSLRLAGVGVQEPLWHRLGALAPPVLVLAGATDPRFAAVGARLARGARQGAFSLVPGAGHAAHLAQADLAARLVERFLA